MIIKALFDERLANNWSNHEVAVKFSELSNGPFVSYLTLKNRYDVINRQTPVLQKHKVTTLPTPIPTSNRFDTFSEQHEIIETERIVANPSNC